MIDFSNCKINIGLEIVSKRDDGYHNLESIFYPVPLNDSIEIIPNENGFELSQSGFIVEGEVESNLIYKAWKLLNQRFNFGGIKVHLHKQVPMGAGLGGGSANAARVLQMINKEFNLELTDDDLIPIAAKIGSDCPFFIYNKPAFAYNTGTDFVPSKLDLSGYYIVIIKPEISISTQEAYYGIATQKSEIDLKNIKKLSLADWKNNVVNRFEKHLFVKYKQLQEIKNQLYNHGAIYASMSGSGSAIYGIFNKEVELIEFSESYFIWKGIL